MPTENNNHLDRDYPSNPCSSNANNKNSHLAEIDITLNSMCYYMMQMATDWTLTKQCKVVSSKQQLRGKIPPLELQAALTIRHLYKV